MKAGHLGVGSCVASCLACELTASTKESGLPWKTPECLTAQEISVCASR